MAGKRRRHLSPAHRAAISRGVKRYYRQERQRAARRSRAAQRAARTRAAKKEKVATLRQVRTVERQAVAQTLTRNRFEDFPSEEITEWEVTVKYSGKDGTVDITIRVLGPRINPGTGRPTTNEEVKGVAWRRVHGGTLTLFQVDGIDWTNARGKDFHYADAADVFQSMRGLVRTVGWAGLRVAEVEQ